MKIIILPERITGIRSPLLYGHFIEHFHRQIYGGIYDPGNPLSDDDGFRVDVMDAMRRIRVPILRWPGGCFVSAYHWKDGVGPERRAVFDKAWRVEEPNTFGTDEYVRFCRKVGCEPYICTNAGTGTAEEMSDWVEYCNLENEGAFARQRIQNGSGKPYGVRYWSIGNENYGWWEIGAKSAEEWGRLTLESAKMIKHVDPSVELSAAALTDLDWNVRLLQSCGEFLDWISIHEYWDMVQNTNACSDYDGCMRYTKDLDHSVRKVRGLLMAMGLEKQIRIAFDEWNLRGWYHPGVHAVRQAQHKEDYLDARDANDVNSQYTMADAVFTACFLNMVNRNCDIVGMANFAPAVNTRGCIFTYKDGIVLRPMYHVFDLYVNHLGDIVFDSRTEGTPTEAFGEGEEAVDAVDLLATAFSDRPGYAVAAVNKSKEAAYKLELDLAAQGKAVLHTIEGSGPDSYNDVGRTEVFITQKELGEFRPGMEIILPPHSVNVISIEGNEKEADRGAGCRIDQKTRKGSGPAYLALPKEQNQRETIHLSHPSGFAIKRGDKD